MSLKKNKILFLFFFLLACDRQTEQLREILKVQAHLRNKDTAVAEQEIEKLLNQDLDINLKKKLYLKHAEINSNYLLNYKKAISSYKKVLSYDQSIQTQINIYEKIGAIYFEKIKDFNESAHYYKLLAGFVPQLEKYSFYLLRVASGLLHQKKYSESREVFKQIEAPDKYYPQAVFNIGLSYFYEKNWEQALVNLRSYIELEKDISKITFAKYLIANIYESNENLERAYSVYYSILTDYPEPEIIKRKLKAVYERRVARKR